MWNKINNKNKDRNQLKVLNGQRANKINRIKCWLKGLIKLIKSTHTVKVARCNWNLRLFPSRGRIYVSSPKCELDFVSFLSPTEFGRCVTNYFQTSSGKAKWLLPGLRGDDCSEGRQMLCWRDCMEATLTLTLTLTHEQPQLSS